MSLYSTQHNDAFLSAGSARYCVIQSDNQTEVRGGKNKRQLLPRLGYLWRCQGVCFTSQTCSSVLKGCKVGSVLFVTRRLRPRQKTVPVRLVMAGKSQQIDMKPDLIPPCWSPWENINGKGQCVLLLIVT